MSELQRETMAPPASCDTVVLGDLPPDAAQPLRETMPAPVPVDPDFQTAVQLEPETAPAPEQTPIPETPPAPEAPAHEEN